MPRRSKGRKADIDSMQYWLVRTLTERAEAAGIERKAIWLTANVHESTISRFVRYQTWPQTIDQIVVAYARLLHIDDPRDLWTEAAQRFKKHGRIPTLGELDPATLAALSALEAGQQSEPFHDESSNKPTSNGHLDEGMG